MDDAEFIGVIIGFATLGVMIIALFLDSRKNKKEFDTERENIKKDREFIQKERETVQRDRETLEELRKLSKVLIDIVSNQKDEITALQSGQVKQQGLSEAELKLKKDQHDWQVIRDIGTALGWVFDRANEKKK